MEIIDPHVHVDHISRRDLGLMAASGVRAVVSHTYYPHLNVEIRSQTILDYYERVMKFETWRSDQELIHTYVCISLNPVSIPVDYQKVLEAMPKYLGEKNIVAIGEVGLDPGSKTCPDLAVQEEIVRAQLRLANQYGKPVVFHTPATDKEKWVRKYFDLITQEKVNPAKVVIDHADATVAGMIANLGGTAGISVQPWRNMTPESGAKVASECPYDKVLIDSDCSPLLSDPMSVPKTVHEMRRLGMSKGDINKIVFENPCRIYNLDWK
jgi:predicted metal-dependent TIM-barrel fold hydrolase